MRCVECQRNQENVTHTLTLPCLVCGAGMCMYHTCSLALAVQQCDFCYGYTEEGEEEDWYDGGNGSGDEEEEEGHTCTPLYSHPRPTPKPVRVPQTTAPGNTCSICWESFENREAVSPMCGSNKHIFHDTCLSNWWERSQTCPLCRG